MNHAAKILPILVIRLCNSTKNGNKDPNLAVRTGERFEINAIGFQGINCCSKIYFNHKKTMQTILQ